MNIQEFKSKKTVIFDKIDNYKNYRNWIIGNFEPSLLKTEDFEIAVFNIKKGEKSDRHYHSKSVELNIIISGECLVNCSGIKHKLKAGDIFCFPPKVKSDVHYTSDTVLIVIKTPSIPGDKHWDNEDDEDDGA